MARLVVIDEEPRGDELLAVLLALIELDRRRDAVRRAAPEVALVVDRRALRPQVDGGGKSFREPEQRCGVEVVARVGQFVNPTVTAVRGTPANAQRRQRIGCVGMRLSGGRAMRPRFCHRIHSACPLADHGDVQFQHRRAKWLKFRLYPVTTPEFFSKCSSTAGAMVCNSFAREAKTDSANGNDRGENRMLDRSHSVLTYPRRCPWWR